jgi:hypothetical protein
MRLLAMLAAGVGIKSLDTSIVKVPDAPEPQVMVYPTALRPFILVGVEEAVADMLSALATTCGRSLLTADILFLVD